MSGKRIRAIREKRGDSLEALAQLAGIGKTTLWRIETGRVEASTDTLKKLAAVLEVSVAYLSGESDAVGDVYAEDALSPLERRLLNNIREGRTVDALEAFHALLSGKK